MTVKEKAENFYKMAIESATASNLSQVNAYKERLDKQEEDEKRQIDESCARDKKYEMDQILKEKNASLAVSEIEKKHEYAELCIQLKEQLFQEVREKVLAFCKTKEYKELLAHKVSNILAKINNESCVIYVTKQDYDFMKTQPYNENVTVKESESDFWGGAKIELAQKKMIYDLTFAANYAESKLKFQMK